MIHKILKHLVPVAASICVTFSIACSAQTEEQALQSLRNFTRDGKNPPENVVAQIASRFAGKRTGALAKLLHAKIKFDNNDFAGAAALLNSEEFNRLTTVGDHALFLRGQALQQTDSHAEVMRVFERLIAEFPDSIRLTEAKLLWTDSAIAGGYAARVPEMLSSLNSGDALIRMAKAHDAQGNSTESLKYYRRTYFQGAGTEAAKEAEAKLTSLVQPLTPQNPEEASIRAEKLYNSKNWAAADKAYAELIATFPTALTSAVQLRRLTVVSNVRKAVDAQNAFNSIPSTAKEKEGAYYQLAMAYARSRMWPDARRIADEIRAKYPNGKFTPKAWVDAGMAARDAKNKGEEQGFLRSAVAGFPNAVEVAGAQFELAWLEHEANNYARSSTMLVEHLARYVDKDTTNRGKAGYWAARDSERAGKAADACALYEAAIYRYSANWYGYLAQQRLAAMKSQGNCGAAATSALVTKAAANLKTVTVAPETSTPKEIARAEKSELLSSVGLFDWAIDELTEAKKTADNSPKINLALAQHYRVKGDNVNALLALAKSYPDYSQMFPEEMGREEWDVFYPLTNWDQIQAWAKHRNLDQYQVAGLIRQESVFNPRAKSPANAYGLMQLLLPTARSVARKYGSMMPSSYVDLFQPALNIELGTGYMRDQFDKFGRIEYVAVAYNAGPGRVGPWRATLPLEIDEFVEAIPFRETKGYVQGVIRNSAQYRRLYDDNGSFKPNVGTRPLRAEIDARSPEQLAADLPEIRLDTNAESE